MKRSIIILCLLLSEAALAGAGHAQESDVKTLDPALVPLEAARPEEFTPRGWKVHSRAAGDLDGDGRPDLALLLLDQSAENAQRSVENPRPALLILLATPQGRWRRAGLNTHLIVSDGSYFAPLQLEIVRGVVVLRQELQSDISANTNDYATTDSFRYDLASGRFLLIGEENANTHRDAAADGIRVSDNYLTGERLITVLHAARGKYVREMNARRRINPRRVFLEDAEGQEIDFDSLMDEVSRRR